MESFKYYSDPQGRMHAFPLDGSFDAHIPADFVLLTDEEVAARSAPSAEFLRANAIAALEVQITPRRLREAILTGDNSFIKNIEDQIAALRAAPTV